MASVCFYFQVHQPLRIKRYRIFDVGNDHAYFNDRSENNRNNQRILEKVAHKSYVPTNALLLSLLQTYSTLRISFSLSGLVLEQMERFCPEALISFQKLVETGRCEILAETYYHSLSFLYSRDEFMRQVVLHEEKIQNVFRVSPRVFRNTELIYNNDIARFVEMLGYDGILAEGADHVLGWRSPNFLYRPKLSSSNAGAGLPTRSAHFEDPKRSETGYKPVPATAPRNDVRSHEFKILLKNYKLSDDIAFRFSEKSWKEYPLTAPKFAEWVSQVNGNGEVVNLFMDYETFGEHQWEDTGIFEFLRALPEAILKHPDNDFVTPSEAIARFPARGEIDAPSYVSWADTERDLSAWISNDIQRDALKVVYSMERDVLKTHDKRLIMDWRRLQTSDHFYYMCTKWFADGDVHKYFNPYESPYDAFISYMNVVQDMKLRIQEKKNSKHEIRSTKQTKKIQKEEIFQTF